MTSILAITILAAACIILFYCFSRIEKYSPGSGAAGFPIVLFSVWLVATAVWSRPFFEIRVPGFIDLTLDRIVLVLLLLYIVSGLYSGRIAFRKNAGIELCMFLFALACTLSMLIHGFLPALPQFPSPWNHFISGYLFPFIAFLFAKYFIREERDLRIVLQAIFYLGSYLAVISFFEFFNLRHYVFPTYINNPDIVLHLDRARGPFLNAAFNGAAITFGFLCGIHLVQGQRGLTRLCYLALLCLYFPAIFFAQTRSAYLGFLIALTAFFFYYRTGFPKWKVLALPVAIFLVFMVASVPRIASKDRREGGVMQMQEVDIRMALIRRSISMIGIRPFSGVGLAQFLPASSKNFPAESAATSYQEQLQHFHILGMLVELGIIGTGIYLALITLIFKRLYLLRRYLPERGFTSSNLLCVIATVWIVHLTTNLFLEPAYCLFFNAVPFALAGFADGQYGRQAFA